MLLIKCDIRSCSQPEQSIFTTGRTATCFEGIQSAATSNIDMKLRLTQPQIKLIQTEPFRRPGNKSDIPNLFIEWFKKRFVINFVIFTLWQVALRYVIKIELLEQLKQFKQNHLGIFLLSFVYCVYSGFLFIKSSIESFQIQLNKHFIFAQVFAFQKSTNVCVNNFDFDEECLLPTSCGLFVMDWLMGLLERSL